MYRIVYAKLLILLITVVSVFAQVGSEGTGSPAPDTYFRVGERATYNISFGRFEDAGFAEFSVVSKGNIEGHEAFEVRSRMKTYNIVSAAFFFADETRLDFLSSLSRLPLYSIRKELSGLAPTEIKRNFLPDQEAAQHDLPSLLFALRNSVPGGSFSLSENDRTYTVTAQSGANEKLITDAGEFDTNVISIESTFFSENGWTLVKLNISRDEKKIPVLFRATSRRGEIRVKLASYNITLPKPAVDAPPSTIPKAIPIKPPRSAPTPVPYADNEPLSSDLPFTLGESLTFDVTEENQKIGTVILRAKERRQFFGSDSLLFTAEAAEVEKNSKSDLLQLGDSILCYVDPVTLVPFRTEIKAAGSFSAFNQIAQFDQRLGIVTNGKSPAIEVPVGTHSLLSLAFAIRAFNLRQSRDLSNPVNDTRVAIFVNDRALILTLRTTSGEKLAFDGKKVPTHLVSVITGDPEIDAKNIRLWLSADAQRLPLRAAFAGFQANLVNVGHS